MKRWILALAIPLTLSGCVSMSDPMSLGNDVYTLHATGGAYTTQAYLRSDLWEEATELCAKEGKVPVLLNQDGVSGHASFNAPSGNYAGGGFAGGFAAGFGTVSSFSYPESSIVFRCVKPTTPQEPQDTPSDDNNTSAWVNTATQPAKEIVAVDVAKVTVHGDIRKTTTCMAFSEGGHRGITVIDSDFDCRNWKYRGNIRAMLIDGVPTQPSNRFVAMVSEWATPNSNAPTDKQLAFVCKGVPSEALRDAVRENDPVRYANYALDRIQK